MLRPTEAELEKVRATIADAVSAIPPGEDPMWLSEWVLCVAWVDDDGETWLSRFKSSEKMPDYRVEGLLRVTEPSTWDRYVGVDEDD